MTFPLFHKALRYAAPFCLGALTLAYPAALAHAQDTVPVVTAPPTGVSPETAYILNSFMFLVCGILVMWMAAGFAMLEAGFVRARNTSVICLKNVVLYAIAGITYYFIGYNLMYVNVPEGGFIGTLGFFYDPPAAELALLNADDTGLGAATQSVLDAGSYASMADWFFQMVFVATAASIVSGTVAERIKLWPFLIFSALLTAIIYPIQGSWSWGQGWLNGVGGGFKDFAGSTIVHSVGGWAALTGAIILGPRRGKYGEDGKITAIPGSNMPLATIGTLILWMGWFGFNGGSVLALGSAKDATLMSLVMANTNMAAAAGCVTAMLFSQLRYGKPDLTFVLNGALAGLVSITAGPDVASPLTALIIGSIGAILCCLAIPLFDKIKIDDVVGALSVHLVCGIWGTLAVAVFTTGDYTAQITGIAATGVFVCITSSILWLALKYTMGLRVNEKHERYGLDVPEVGVEAYPEFTLRSAGH